VAVHRFLSGQISFNAIPKIIGKVLQKHRPLTNGNLDGILRADLWAREEAAGIG
jgi:1-deoxy-D-xylulose 5-phosphate reductoisomerase